MIRHLYIFCFLVLLIFSCRSSKKAIEEDPATIACKQKAIRCYEEAENTFAKNDYHLAKYRYLEALSFDCMEGVKINYYGGKKKILFKDLINQRITQIDEVRENELKEKDRQCSKILEYAENLYLEKNYLDAKSYFQRYQNSDCSERDSVINSKIKILDSLINLKKN